MYVSTNPRRCQTDVVPRQPPTSSSSAPRPRDSRSRSAAATGECTIGAIVKEHGYVFGESGFANHWQWLTNDWWSVNKAKYDIRAIKDHGVGSKKPKTPDELPFQPTA